MNQPLNTNIFNFTFNISLWITEHVVNMCMQNKFNLALKLKKSQKTFSTCHPVPIKLFLGLSGPIETFAH